MLGNLTDMFRTYSTCSERARHAFVHFCSLPSTIIRPLFCLLLSSPARRSRRSPIHEVAYPLIRCPTRCLWFVCSSTSFLIHSFSYPPGRSLPCPTVCTLILPLSPPFVRCLLFNGEGRNRKEEFRRKESGGRNCDKGSARGWWMLQEPLSSFFC
ncbi:hypothetical protein HOY82DRAFT_555956 [Tuber indicum]|nr:hypothetical protein HOY82DRAFT_555956 [Tuber indicum]